MSPSICLGVAFYISRQRSVRRRLLMIANIPTDWFVRYRPTVLVPHCAGLPYSIVGAASYDHERRGYACVSLLGLFYRFEMQSHLKEAKAMEKEAKEAAHVTEEAKWGTKLMGPPAAPSAHPENERAALWSPRGDDERPPYVLEREPVNRGPGGSPMESILDFFNSWAKKAEDLAHN
ncbi:hypothetical protein BHM03_00061796, partial [Ensete ventricosum]